MKYQVIPREKIKVEGYRLRFFSGEEEIEELAHSIEVNGLICPLGVTKRGNDYKLVTGERRLAALDLLKKEKIPCVVLNLKGNVDDLITAMAENIDRLDISPWERALGLDELVTNYGMTERAAGDRISRSESYVSHYRRLLKKIHPTIKKYLQQRKLTFGHAQVLMKLDDQEKQLEIANRALDEDLTVKQTALDVDRARPPGELTDQEKELNKMEMDIEAEFPNDWRVKVDILQGKKIETILLRVSSRKEASELAQRLLKALS